MNIPKLVGKRIADTRSAKGLSQEGLAIACGWTDGNPQGRISGYESGRRQPSPEKLAAIARALEVPISYFFEDFDPYISEAAAQYTPSERKSSNTTELETLAKIITKVERIAQDNRIDLTPEQKARVITAILETEKSEQEESSSAVIKAALRAATF